MYPSPRTAAALALIWLGLAAPAFAAQSSAVPAAHAHPPYAGEPSQIPANGKPIVLEVGKGTLIRLSRPASTVFVASPDIADVQIKSPELIYVSAKAPGQTVIYAVDGGDTVLLNTPVRVDFDLSELHQSLNRLVPGTDISVTQMDSSLVLSGAVASAGQAEKARVLAAAVAGAVKGGQVIKCFPDRLELQSFTKSVTVRKDDRRRANRG
jgi:Flp pilus assembly secretin CpaC